jgi:GT2 family glycosyltransferase
MQEIWICIPVHNRAHFTVRCLESLAKQTRKDFRLVICDDGSTDGTTEIIHGQYPQAVVLSGDGNLWWTGGINRCIEYVLQHSRDAGGCVVTLNNDLEVPPDYLASLVEAARRYPRAIITSVGVDIQTGQIVTPGDRHNWVTATSSPIDPARDYLPEDSLMGRVTHAAGRGTLIPLEVFRIIGLFDEQHLPHYGADFDFTHRARRAGYNVLVCFAARVLSHVEETGMTKIREHFSLDGFYRYLTSIKSPANLRTRWWFAVKNCPRFLLPVYLVIDLSRVVGSYCRHHMRRVS